MAEGALIPTEHALVAICVSCRTAMARPGRCDCGESIVVDTRTHRGRTRLRHAVWGTDDRQHRLQVAERKAIGLGSLVLFATIAIVLGSLNDRDPLPMVVWVVVLVCGTVSAGIVGLVTWRHEKRQRKRALRPYGAQRALYLATAGNGPRRRFGVVEGETLRSPVRGEPCLAFELSLRTEKPVRRAQDLLWRAARTGGFTVRLDDGDTVHIPAGPIRLSSAPDSARVSHADARRCLPRELREPTEIGLPCMPSDAAFEHLLRPGARVVVVSPLEAREDEHALRENLRASARMALYPVGTPVVAMLDD